MLQRYVYCTYIYIVLYMCVNVHAMFLHSCTHTLSLSHIHTERSQLVGLCGNYEVEEGEECDAGALGMVGADQCCTEDCRLRSTSLMGGEVECR